MNSAALLQSLYTRLTNVVAVTTLVTGIHSRVPQAAQSEVDGAYPFITIGPFDFRPFDTDTDDGQSVVAQIHVWSRSNSELVRLAICDAVYDALHKFDLVISGANTIDCLFDGSTGPMDDPDGRTTHQVMQFRITYSGI